MNATRSRSGLVFAAVTPHGALALEEAVVPAERHLGQPTRAGMAQLARRFTAAAPEVVLILTPHHVHVEGAFAVILAGWLAGHLDEWSPQRVELKVPTHRPFARRALDALRGAGLSAVGVSYGGNDPDSAVAPLDWGSLIPLWVMGGRAEPAVPVVVVCPARELSAQEHVRAGAALARAARHSGQRVALIASADHGHGHTADGPYGYSPASADYDAQICGMLRRGDLSALTTLRPEFVRAALADSYWQLLMLHGALSTGDAAWQSELLSCEAPTYFGMACAAFTPTVSAQ